MTTSKKQPDLSNLAEWIEVIDGAVDLLDKLREDAEMGVQIKSGELAVVQNALKNVASELNGLFEQV